MDQEVKVHRVHEYMRRFQMPTASTAPQRKPLQITIPIIGTIRAIDFLNWIIELANDIYKWILRVFEIDTPYQDITSFIFHVIDVITNLPTTLTNELDCTFVPGKKTIVFVSGADSWI